MKIKKILAVALATMTALMVVGCGQKPATQATEATTAAQAAKETQKMEEKKTVVATTTFMADQAKQLAGDFVNVELIIPAGDDPHVYEAKPEDLKKLEAADLVLYHGLHFEGKMVEALEKLRDAGKAVETTAKFEKSELGQMEEDGVVETDPHFWFDLNLYKKSVLESSAGLQKLLPEHADKIKENTENYIKQLKELDEYVKTELAKIPEGSRKLITPHDAFGYFARSYNIEVKAPQGVTTEGEVSTADINETVDYIVKNKVKAIFVESTTDPARMQKLQEAVKAKGFEVKVVMGEGKELLSDSLAPAGEKGDNFIDMVKHNVDLMVENLK